LAVGEGIRLDVGNAVAVCVAVGDCVFVGEGVNVGVIVEGSVAA
jgi:co-chaperonin GroES (HSP10)